MPLPVRTLWKQFVFINKIVCCRAANPKYLTNFRNRISRFFGVSDTPFSFSIRSSNIPFLLSDSLFIMVLRSVPLFKETVGKSPQQFLLSYRMAKAAELLKLTSLSVSDIGNAVGYPNQLHFSRAFKNVYGMPPWEWRNTNRLRVLFVNRAIALTPSFSPRPMR